MAEALLCAYLASTATPITPYPPPPRCHPLKSFWVGSARIRHFVYTKHFHEFPKHDQWRTDHTTRNRIRKARFYFSKLSTTACLSESGKSLRQLHINFVKTSSPSVFFPSCIIWYLQDRIAISQRSAEVGRTWANPTYLAAATWNPLQITTCDTN